MDVQQMRQLQPRLTEYLSQFDACFGRRDTREHLPVYVKGQLSDLPQKSVEPIALKSGVPPRTLQMFLAAHAWDEDAMRRRLQEIVADEHGGPTNSVGIIDETSDVKKGKMTPGVQRQHCGAVGKQENCIVTVHLGYAVDDFHCLVDGELFLPEVWSDDRDRCRAAGIPDTMTYRPKTEIALELYDRAQGNGLHFEWLTFDEWYGSKPPFLRALDQREQKFVGEVHKDFVAWTKPPKVTTRPFRRHGRGRGRRIPRVVGSRKPITVGAMLRYSPRLRDQPWRRFRVKDGEKGPMVWEVKHLPIYPKDEDGLPARPYHLMVARNVLNPTEVKYFVSNAPPETSIPKLMLVAFSRWRIERCFEDEKGEIGLDHYEGRTYRGLKRHLILSAVSHLFLAKVHQDFRGEKSGADRLPGAYGSSGGGDELVALGSCECIPA